MNNNHNLFELNDNLIDNNNCSNTSTPKLQITTTIATSQVQNNNSISINNN